MTTITFKREAPSWGYLATIKVPIKKANKIIKKYENYTKGGYYNFKKYDDYISIGYNLWNDIEKEFKLLKG